MNLNSSGKASIIILTHNNLKYTRQCLESIFSKTRYPDYEIIVVDNASQDDTLKYLDEIKATQNNFQIVRNQTNVGFSRGNNQGARASTGEYLIFLNNDTVVTEGWLTRLIEHLQDPTIGMIGPVTNSASNEAKIEVPYKSIEDMENFAQDYTQVHHGESFEISALAFFCVAIRTEKYREIGPLDERFGLGMFEDDDYAIRVRDNGYKVICTEDVFIHHWGGASFLELDPYKYWLLFKENRKKFEKKWNTTWQPHLQRKELLADQAVQLSEAVYRLQLQLLTEAKLEPTDESFEFIVNRSIEQDRSIEQKDQEIEQKDQEIEQLSTTLEEIYDSNAWRIVQLIWSARRAIFPEGSRREAVLSSLIKTSGQLRKGKRAYKSPQISTQSPALGDQGGISTVRAEISERNIAILAPQFFDLDGQSVYIGGAERYLIELTRIIRELNCEPVVYQSAIGEWEREYLGIPFFGLDSHGDAKKLNVMFHRLIKENTPVIYLVFNLASPFHSNRSIGISHGVYWDHHHEFSEDRERFFKSLLTSFSNLGRIVSVDTNTINWIRTVQPSLAEKCVYIPNFVDIEKFKPGNRSELDRLVILYPRRLYTPRGFWMVHELVLEFLETYPNVEFRFIGQANPEEQAAVQKLVRKSQGRVIWQTVQMEDMHHVYDQADITLIPTMYSEGTSLSCLEAMASGNAVIATNIGGLPDLIISGYNGLLIDPVTSALREALSILIDDPEMRQELGQRARETAYTFDINIWQSRWKKILNEMML